MKYAIAAAMLLLCAEGAQAQDVETYTTFPLGNSWVTTGPNGYSATTSPLGNGAFTTVNPGFLPPAAPSYYPPVQLLQPRPLVAPQGWYR